MERWQGRVAVVTGTSAGIGAAIAYQLQDAGVHVVALARRKEKIAGTVEQARKDANKRGRSRPRKASVPGKLHCLQCDVQKEEDIVNVFKWVKENLKTVHILVNNAGIGGAESLSNGKTEGWKNILDTNVLGLSICTREALQLMAATGVDDGHIVHIGSVIGHTTMDFPDLQMYSASKHAVRVLTEGLRKELVAAKKHIRVTEVSPGAVKTDFNKVRDISESTLKLFNANSKDDIFNHIKHLLPEDCADAVLYAISTPPHVQIHEIIIHPVGEEF